MTPRSSKSGNAPRSMPVSVSGQSVMIVQGGAYNITTLAGGLLPAAVLPGTSAVLPAPKAIASDGSGSVYFVSDRLNAAFQLDAAGNLSRIAANVVMNLPEAIAADGSGNVYIGEAGNEIVRKVTPDGVVSTYAGGTGSCCSAPGDGRACAPGPRRRRFNPRPRAGGDEADLDFSAVVSIHAPRAGGDAAGRLLRRMQRFNPRPRAGGDWNAKWKLFDKLVSIHAPARGATVHGDHRSGPALEFQSTPPRGGRRTAISGMLGVEVSIHAPARGATLRLGVPRRASMPFQSTPPRGGRP